uniref:Interleukin-15 receptor subunit alpha n=1 Tax=Trachidermus fasciatus TaxID=290630 RepID=A0A8A2ICJ9_TRAFA|nr:interleukin-15 receptor subunit alpha [Trachidermus fasciatus]
MDLGSPFELLLVCAMLICVLGAARCSSDNICPCPEIPERNDTQPAEIKCFQIGETFRYKCKEHNLRKAGTSNFIKCKQIGNTPPQWVPSNINLECIADPRRTTTQAPESTVTTAPSGTQMTQSLSTPSVSAEPERAEPTSPGLQAQSGHSHAGNKEDVTETEQTTPTLTATRTAVIVCVSVVIVCALIGIGIFCYKRRSKSDNPQQTPEEQFPLKVPSNT